MGSVFSGLGKVRWTLLPASADINLGNTESLYNYTYNIKMGVRGDIQREPFDEQVTFYIPQFCVGGG